MKGFFGREPAATLLICIQRKRATFSTTGSPASTTGREEARSASAGLSPNATEVTAARARGAEDGESSNSPVSWISPPRPKKPKTGYSEACCACSPHTAAGCVVTRPPGRYPHHPGPPAACGSGLAGDNGHVTSYIAPRLTEHVHTTWSCVSVTALVVITTFTDLEN